MGKIAGIGISVLTALTLFSVGIFAVGFLMADGWLPKLMGFALFVLLGFGIWMLVKELLFGSYMNKIAKTMEYEGTLDVDDRPKNGRGKVDREYADQEFEHYSQCAHENPDDYRNWYKLSLAYNDSQDRTRARQAMRQAISLYKKESKAQ